MRTPEEIIQIKERAQEQLFKIPGVTMVAVGRKQSKGKLTDDISILVYVVKKKGEKEIPDAEMIPAEIEGVKTDVIESGRMKLLGPHKGGTPVESSRGLGGTLGCFGFTTEATPRAVLLTNQHVLMNRTETTPLGGDAGPVVCSICSPCCSKIIGSVFKVVLSPTLDGAIALLNPGIQFLAEVEEIGLVSGVHDVTPAEAAPGTYAVKMYSREQGSIVNGTVHSITGSGISHLHDGSVHRNYVNQMVINSTDKFSVPGDSGSVVFNNNNEVVGLIFGGNDAGTVSTACLVSQVQNELQITLATATAAGQVYTVPGAPSTTTAGDPIAVSPPLTGGAFVRAEKLKAAYNKILSTEKGCRYDALYHTHMEEVRTLVNTNKRVATVWHRNQGPAFLIHFSNSLADKTYTLPDTVRSVSLADLLNNMAAILTRYGTDALRKDIESHLPEILAFAASARTTDELIEGMIRKEEKDPVPQL